MTAMYWICFHFLLLYESLLLKTSGGKFRFDLRRSKWGGVFAFKSWESSDTFVSRLALRIASTWYKSACKNLYHQSLRTCLAELIKRSHAPPICEVVGGLNIHCIFLWSRNWFISRLGSFLPLLTFEPLSYLISSGFPLLE